MPVKHNVVMEITIAWKPRKPPSAPRRGVLLVAVASFHPVSETVPLSDTYRFQEKKKRNGDLHCALFPYQILSHLMMYQEDRFMCTVS